MPFAPIAIVGQGCVLPGALTPKALAEAAIAGRDLVTSLPPGYWGLDPSRLRDRAETDRGGYVQGFEQVFDPVGFAVAPDSLRGLDPVFLWLLHVGRAALADGGGFAGLRSRATMVVGNLSYPTRGHADFALGVWLDADVGATARNRFSSGHPARFAADALGLSQGGFSLDAACASSLYALKLACDRLHDGTNDLMLAAAVNHADNLFLHVGFTALRALSPSGRSRPFQTGADGLLPAEGAACLALRRLEDAERDGDRILGVIRGIGLSNDGARHGFLVPDADGQVEALTSAYRAAEIDPASVGLLECHATGTAAGDVVEVQSAARVFAGCADLPVGSLKSNMGHLITVAGLAGIIKVMGAMAAGIRPPTLNVEQPISAFADTPLRPLLKAEPWDSSGPRVAGVSAFGFGGNNAHVVVEEWRPRSAPRRVAPAAAPVAPPRLAVCAIGMATGAGRGYDAFRTQLFAVGKVAPTRNVDGVELPLAGLRFPPADLRAALAQQTLMLEAALAALGTVGDAGRLGVLVGMGCDPESARFGARWRNPDQLDDSFCGPLGAADVLGTMPNLPANRLNAQFDARAFGYTVAAEELSGFAALRIAARALAAGEADTVLVGASEVIGDKVHDAAARALLPATRQVSGDAAVALVVTTPERAARLGIAVKAVISFDHADDGAQPAIGLQEEESVVTARFGHAHAAAGLLHVVAAIAACETAMLPKAAGGVPWIASADSRALAVRVSSFDGAADACRVSAGTVDGISSGRPAVGLFAADDLGALAAAVSAGRPGVAGRRRLALVGADGNCYRRAQASALAQLAAGNEPSGEGIVYGTSDATGELAFVFPGAAAAYPGMGRAVFAALPEITELLAASSPAWAGIAAEVFGGGDPADPLAQLRGCTFLCQAHARLALDWLKLRPNAAIGLSSGETNAILAFGAWRDPGDLLADIAGSRMYGQQLTGACEAAAVAWGWPADQPVDWVAWRLLVPAGDARAAIAAMALKAHVTIVNAPDDCVVAGLRSDCDRLIARLGRDRAIDLQHPMIVHCPELQPVAGMWHRIHARTTYPVDGVRFYANAWNRSYALTRESIADALTTQALTPIDFPATIRRAWDDGVRSFLALGPRDTLTGAIGKVLAGRPHRTVAIDARGSGALAQLGQAIAVLHVAGHALDYAAVHRAFAPPAIAAAQPRRLSLPARRPSYRPAATTLPPDADIQAMPAAPALPPVLDLPPVAVFVPADPPAARTLAAAGRPMARVAATQLIAGVDALHRDFLASQLRLYDDYLALQQRLIAGAPVAANSGSAAIPASPTPTPIPAAIVTVGQANPSKVMPMAADRAPTTPTGPRFDRAQLEVLAGGRVSDVLGPTFVGQDRYRRQVRLPQPPMLLADRVVGIDGDAGGMGLGTIWTETDVCADSWYLHDGRMPPGILIESGQADLLLISWLGVDALNQDRRVYRLLGCKLTFHGPRMPAPGDTLHYEIHVDGHAKTGDVRLFFFHYDCWIGGRRWISVRDGQAGFFTDDELAASGGVLWDAARDTPDPAARLDPPPCPSAKRAFSPDEVSAYVAGDAWRCFGTGFERAASHQRTPTPTGPATRLIDKVTAFDPAGGPWGRGYLCAEATAAADSWFYPGHFKNDPCMPGTLMADAAFQAQCIMMAALGFTIDRDGWRFEPVPDEEFKFICRGQVIPDRDHTLTYEVFVEEVVDGPEPRLYAAMLCKSDGFKVFQCRRFGVRLAPEWPLTSRTAPLPPPAEARGFIDPAGTVHGDYAALLACAWGRPSDAFGAMYSVFDGARRAPRLPGPPYHVMSRIAAVDCPAGEVTAGGSVTAIYDVPPDAWYFTENAAPLMPLAVLMEVMLQPCGWLASYMGIAARAAVDYRFRNLDGSGASLRRHVGPHSGTLTTRATLTKHAQAGSTVLVFFHVECGDADGTVMSFDTSFGFFTDAAFASQPGLPEPPAATGPAAGAPVFAYSAIDGLPPDDGAPPLAQGSLRMIDGVRAFWPDGGADGLGRIVGRQAIDPAAWYFKAHFFQDPVQPGSLGIEALIQLLQALMRLKGLHEGIKNPVFEPLAIGEPLSWRYRGQVVPTDAEVETEVTLTRIERKSGGVVAVARGCLRCDGKRIYEVENLAVGIVEGRPAPATAVAPELFSIERVGAYWRARIGIGLWPGEALLTALLRRFVRRLSFADQTGMGRLAQGPAIYLANHQTGIESMLFSYAMGAVAGRPIMAIAKQEHTESWLGRLYACLGRFPGAALPRMALYFDRDDRASMLRLMQDARALLTSEGYGLLVHVEGTRSTRARDPVRRVTGVLFDLVEATGLPVVPVRFARGLPVDRPESGVRRELPYGFGGQDIHIGAPVSAEVLRGMTLRDKQAAIIAGINTLGPDIAGETPAEPDGVFARQALSLATAAGVDPLKGAFLAVLTEDADCRRMFGDTVRALMAADPTAARGALDGWYRDFYDWMREGEGGAT